MMKKEEKNEPKRENQMKNDDNFQNMKDTTSFKEFDIFILNNNNKIIKKNSFFKKKFCFYRK